MVSYPNQVHCTQIHVVSSQNCINWDYNKNCNLNCNANGNRKFTNVKFNNKGVHVYGCKMVSYKIQVDQCQMAS